MNQSARRGAVSERRAAGRLTWKVALYFLYSRLCYAAVSRGTTVRVVSSCVPASRPATAPLPRRRVCQRIAAVPDVSMPA